MTTIVAETDKLKLIMAQDAAGELHLWACRGEGKGCKRNLHRKSLKPCDDCYGPLPPAMTLGDVVKKLAQGDA